MNASQVVQLLILLDQITAQVVKLVDTVKESSGADEAALRELLERHRAANDFLYGDVIARLKARAAE